MVSPPGFEPGASGLGGSRSILLSYGDRCEIFLGITGFLRFAPDSYKPGNIVAENTKISRFSGTEKRRKGAKCGKQFLIAAARAPTLWVGDRARIFKKQRGEQREADPELSLPKNAKLRIETGPAFRSKKAVFRMTGYFLGGGPSIPVRYGGI